MTYQTLDHSDLHCDTSTAQSSSSQTCPRHTADHTAVQSNLQKTTKVIIPHFIFTSRATFYISNSSRKLLVIKNMTKPWLECRMSYTVEKLTRRAGSRHLYIESLR